MKQHGKAPTEQANVITKTVLADNKSTTPALQLTLIKNEDATPVVVTKQADDEEAAIAAPVVTFDVPDSSVCQETWKFDATPNGLIRRFISHYGRQFAYRPAEGAWMRWDGKVWRTDKNNMEVMDAMRCVAESIVHIEAKLLAARDKYVLTLQQELMAAKSKGDPKVGELAALLRAVKQRLEDAHKTYGVRSQVEPAVRSAVAGAQKHLVVPEEQWDGPNHLLNCQNGIVNLKTGELLPHRQSWRFTQITKCDYNRDAMMVGALPTVLDHLSDGRMDVQEYLQRWIGQALTGDVSAASILYVYGKSQVGKSTLFNAVMFMLGEGGDDAVSFSSTAKPEAFMKKTASHDEGFHHLRRCRMVVIIEVQGGMLDNSKLKAISGGDAWDSRRAGGSSEKYFPRMSILMTSNKLTVIAPEDQGLMERFQPYQVTRPLAKSKRTNTVKQELQSPEGMEAILAWAVNGAKKWYADGANNEALKAPAFFGEELSEYTRDMDSVQGWLDDNVVLVQKDHRAGFPAKAIDLYNNYVKYTTGKGMRKTAFYRDLAERGFTRTETRRWTLREGKNKGKTRAPAMWILGLYISAAPGDYNYGDSIEDLGGNVPLDPHYAYDNGCDGACNGCGSRHCQASHPGTCVPPFTGYSDDANAA